MKPFRIFGRNIRDAFKSVFRNFSLSLASIICITITLLVLSIAIILTYNVNNFAENMKKEVTIVVFVEQHATDEQIESVENDIKKIEGIKKIVKKSRKEIMDEMMASSDTFKTIMKDWTLEDTPIQDTFEVTVEDIKQIDDIADKIGGVEETVDGKTVRTGGITFVDEVKYGKSMVKNLISIFDIVKNVSIGIVIALIIVTAFLISNTIKITIFSRKREIEIMRLVGASNINIKIPFIFEGLFLGILGSIIPVASTIYGYMALYNNFDGQFLSPFIKLVEPEPFIYVISIVLVIIGIIVGMFGSLRAVKKHLKI